MEPLQQILQMEGNTNTLILPVLTSSPHHNFLSNHLLQHNTTSLHPQLRILCTTKYHHLSCNAKNFNSEGFNFHAQEEDNEEEENVNGWRRKQKKRKWWSDKPQEVEEEEEPDTVLEEFLNSIWILKVFKSFGWTLPPIVLSLLLATGLKAFLIALALPFGQSAFSFALEKMWEQPKRKKKRKNRTSKTQFTGSTSNINVEEEQDKSQNTRKRKMGYQSWVDGNAASGNAGSGNEGPQETPSFGGWDELEASTRRYRGPRINKGSKRSMMNGRLTKKNRSQSPLLLRLLIAAFPFLSSWTKLFF